MVPLQGDEWPDTSASGQMRTFGPMLNSTQSGLSNPRYLEVGIANSAPFAMLADQRCMTDFCLV